MLQKGIKFDKCWNKEIVKMMFGTPVKHVLQRIIYVSDLLEYGI